MDGIVRRSIEPGAPPGTLAGRAPVGEEALHFTLVEYAADAVEVEEAATVERCKFHLATPEKTWIDVAGRASAQMLNALGDAFHLHPLALEDVFHSHQRPKLDIYEQQGFIVLNDPVYVDGEIKPRQVSIFFGENYVISFHDADEDIFRPVRERVLRTGSRLRRKGIDYLVYALVDLVVDRKFPVIEKVSAQLESLEDEALDRPTSATLKRIHEARRALMAFHRIQWAERETVLSLMRPEVPFVIKETRTYMRDCFDHTVAVMELIESYRDMANGLMEVYLMDTSNRMNEVMKTLAIITAFFMPLSFLTGIYGMNFETETGNMPELKWPFGYVYFWCMVAVIVIGLFLWMKRKRWF
ncbi:magnesium/cobalt transporter CorA [Vineibacter terrae]|uniref:Magnesium transport protein CorA n=1 Tax=Vineibacter terrae TaxID=2586908 RepID=A0A5C8PPY5_9HYPH|nr:magnesium/cobalt transporter CorA [Vineibacter terrae]TXL76783.1 magnesium/cobalt transporter CorA [Vineibacter terrae]